MSASLQQEILKAAGDLISIQKPNSDSHEILYEKALFFGRKSISLFQDRDNPPGLSDVESIISEIGEVEVDQGDLDREYLLIAYELTSFGNMLLKYVAFTMREREALSDNYEVNQAEIRELTEAVSKLNEYIEDEVKSAKAESKLLKASGMVEINVLFLSIPMQSVFSLIKYARNELERTSSINIRYVSSLLKNANHIARDYWRTTKETLGRIPERFKTFVASVDHETSVLASKAMNLVIKSKIRRFTPRNTEFSRESTAYGLAIKRDMLIGHLIHFRKWRPKTVKAIFASAMYLLMSDRIYFPYSEKILQEISKQLVILESEPPEVVHNYMCIKAEALIDALSEGIRSTEKSK
jgi:hypothetical protein